jgi:SAM-dependent methyltransferase
MSRAKFALRMLRARFDGERQLCPYCESRHFTLLQRKWLIMQARKCQYCGLIFRWPTDKGADNRAYYEQDYDAEYATTLPDLTALSEMTKNNFRHTRCDKSHRIQFLETVGLTSRSLLDFGCAWGYTAYQYQQAGYRVTGYEIDRNRALFGQQQLGLTLYSRREDVENAGPFDLILADHSLEHMPDPGEGLRLFTRVTRDQGHVVIFVPNGACVDARRRGVGVRGGPYIGEPHTVAFTPEWFIRNLPRHGFSPRFYTPQGERLRGDDYLADQPEIALVATRCE